MGARDEDAREMCLEVYKEEKRKVKRCIYHSKREVQEQSGRKMNQNMNGNRKLFWKDVSKANGGKVKNSNRIKDGNLRLVLEEAEVRRIWREYYEYLYNIDTQKQVAVHMFDFNGVRRGNYFGGISLLSVVGKTCAGILEDRVRKVTEGLIDGEQGRFRE